MAKVKKVTVDLSKLSADDLDDIDFLSTKCQSLMWSTDGQIFIKDPLDDGKLKLVPKDKFAAKLRIDYRQAGRRYRTNANLKMLIHIFFHFASLDVQDRVEKQPETVEPFPEDTPIEPYDL